MLLIKYLLLNALRFRQMDSVRSGLLYPQDEFQPAATVDRCLVGYASCHCLTHHSISCSQDVTLSQQNGSQVAAGAAEQIAATDCCKPETEAQPQRKTISPSTQLRLESTETSRSYILARPNRAWKTEMIDTSRRMLQI